MHVLHYDEACVLNIAMHTIARQAVILVTVFNNIDASFLKVRHKIQTRITQIYTNRHGQAGLVHATQ